jgi:uncharacterized damage-inducible protein DinB
MDAIPAAFLSESRKSLADAQDKIVHCLRQLNDDQVNWRPFEQQNSLANITLHLCGNVRQWIISGVGGTSDTRNRPAEFADRNRYTVSELIDRLNATVREADNVIARVALERLLQPVRIQGFDTTPMGAIWHSVSHFVGHSQEIINITRFQLREKYVFKFVPKTKEQGA